MLLAIIVILLLLLTAFLRSVPSLRFPSPNPLCSLARVLDRTLLDDTSLASYVVFTVFVFFLIHRLVLPAIVDSCTQFLRVLNQPLRLGVPHPDHRWCLVWFWFIFRGGYTVHFSNSVLSTNLWLGAFVSHHSLTHASDIDEYNMECKALCLDYRRRIRCPPHH